MSKQKPADDSSGFQNFVAEGVRKFSFLFPRGGRHFSIPVIVTLVAHSLVIATMLEIDIVSTRINLTTFELLSLTNAILCFTFLIARPPREIETHNILRKFPNFHRKFNIESPELFKEFSDRANQSSEKFITYWSLTCLLWTTYYFVSFGILKRPAIHNLWIDIFFDVFNYASTFSLFACYYILNFPTFKSSRFSITRPLMVIGGIFVLILFFDVTFKHDLLGLSSVTESKQMTSMYWIYGCLGGFIASTLFAMLIARLDSKTLQVPVGLIFFLFLYAAIQAFYPLLDFLCKHHIENSKESYLSQNTLQLFRDGLIAFSIWGKLVLFLIVFWIVDKHRLYMYFVRMNDIDKRYPSSRAEIYTDLTSIE